MNINNTNNNININTNNKKFIGGGFPGIIENIDSENNLENNVVKKREFSLKNILSIDKILPRRVIKNITN